jgi:hypothetical protein
MRCGGSIRPTRKAVRIRSTRRLLLEALGKSRGGQGFVGTVRYLPEKPLMKFARQALSPGHLDMISNAARTLLVKRPAFRHEAEVRLLWYAAKDSADGLFRYAVNPHELVDQIMIDPRLPTAEYYKAKMMIRNQTGYSGKILRSLIYAPPSELMPASGSIAV